MGLLDSVKGLFKGDPFDIANNIQIGVDFKEPVPYQKYRHAVMGAPLVLTESGYCESSSGLRLLSKDNKNMVAMDIHCYGVKHKGRGNLAQATINLLMAFKKIGINIELNPERTYVLPENYHGLLGRTEEEEEGFDMAKQDKRKKKGKTRKEEVRAMAIEVLKQRHRVCQREYLYEKLAEKGEPFKCWRCDAELQKAEYLNLLSILPEGFLEKTEYRSANLYCSNCGATLTISMYFIEEDKAFLERQRKDAHKYVEQKKQEKKK